MSVSIKYKGSEIASMDATGTKTLQTSGKYCEADIVVENTESGGGGSGHTVEDAIITKSISGAYTNDRVTTIGEYVFRSCKSLTWATLPNVQSIGDYAFYQCTKLAAIQAQKATNIGSYAFFGCTALTSVSLPNAANILAYAFYQCTSLATVSLPKASPIPNSAFMQCRGLKKVDLGAPTSIGLNAFNGCSLLETLIIRRTNGVSSLNGSAALNGTLIANGTGYIYVPAALVDAYKEANNWTKHAAQFRAIEDYPEITGG